MLVAFFTKKLIRKNQDTVELFHPIATLIKARWTSLKKCFNNKRDGANKIADHIKKQSTSSYWYFSSKI